MLRNYSPLPLRALFRLFSALGLLALICAALPPAAPARAAGSDQITAGWRPFIEWHETATSGGIARRTTIKAFVQAGEHIFLGSSVMGVLQGNVRIRPPTGTLPANLDTCVERGGGRINNRAQEVGGPALAPAANQFLPCWITAAETTTAGTGIWEFDFISPNPAAGVNNDPTPIRFNDEWALPAVGSPGYADRLKDFQNFWTSAWEVSVRAGTANPAVPGAEIGGRVFASYLSYNLGGNARTSANPAQNRPDLGLDSVYYFATYDGYTYRVDMNAIDPFGFIFFANAEGITDARGNPVYRSLQLLGAPPNVTLPQGYFLHNPASLDNTEANSITHKLFFEPPAADLPLEAQAPGTRTWLRRPPVSPPTAQNFAFTGVEGTSGQAGTNPLGGYFTFEAPPNTAYRLSLDTNRSGTFGDTVGGFTDRILLGSTSPGVTRVFWDGLDGGGQKVEAGGVPFNAEVQLFAGEIHFPFIDAENNPNGLILQRVDGGNLAVDPFTIYWDDSYTYDPRSAYDYSLCAIGDAPAPPAGSISPRPADPNCYGVEIDARRALTGADSSGGSHRYTNQNSPGQGFGDRRMIDTWAYYPAPTSARLGNLVLAEADLAITKTSAPSPLFPGDPMTYTLTVTNNGLSDVEDARVIDEVPAAVLNVSWTCSVPAGQGNCDDPGGSGNQIDTTVDLLDGGVATFIIQGNLSPTASGSIQNTASVRRPNDSTDPDESNNTATNTTPIIAVADLELTKSIGTPPAQIVSGGLVSFTLQLRNRGPSTATNVAVDDDLPAGLTFDSFSASQGSYDSASGTWTVGTLPRDAVATLTLVTRWNGSPVTNTAQVSASDQPDPDSTPNNSDATEDDQSSASLPLRQADLELTKRVSAPRVNVGSNVTFTIELVNRGPDGATNVRVSDRLPAGLAFVSASPSQGSYDEIGGDWAVGSLAANGQATLTIVATLLRPGSFTNIAQVAASDQHDPDSRPNNDNPNEDDQGFATVAGDQADLSLSKAVDNPQPPFRGRITYTIVVRNDGPSAATGVEVTDRLPAGLTFVGANASQGSYTAGTGLWVVGNLAVNGSASLSIQADVTSTSPIVNTAEISAADQPDRDSTPGNGDPLEDDQASATLTPQVADLRLTKVVDNSSPAIGGEVTFTIELTNDGPSRATNVQVSERLPAGLTYVSHVAGQGSYNPASGLWSVGDLNLNATTTLQIRVRLASAGPYTNTAQVSKSDQFDPDSTPNNGNPSEDDQDSVTIAAAMADLSVSKGVNVQTLPADGIVVFSVGVRNDGPSPAAGVRVGERLPARSVLLSTATAKGSYDTATNEWLVGNLAVGETASLSLTVQLDPGGPFINTAEVTASNLPDPDSTPNNGIAGEDDQASAGVNFSPAPPIADLELTKRAVSAPKLVDGVVFILELTNKGPDTATNVEVIDRLPAGLVFVNAAPSQGSYNHETGAWTVGQLSPNAIATLEISALFMTDNPITNTAQVSRSDQFDPDSTPNNSNPAEDDQDSVTISRPTSITLLSFSAGRARDGVLVEWATGAELNTAGFHLYRSADGTRGNAEQVTGRMLKAYGGPQSGYSYSYPDRTARPGVSYSYWLVEVERGGRRSEHGPARVGAGLTESSRLYLPMLWR